MPQIENRLASLSLDERHECQSDSAEANADRASTDQSVGERHYILTPISIYFSITPVVPNTSSNTKRVIKDISWSSQNTAPYKPGHCQIVNYQQTASLES